MSKRDCRVLLHRLLGHYYGAASIAVLAKLNKDVKELQVVSNGRLRLNEGTDFEEAYSAIAALEKANGKPKAVLKVFTGNKCGVAKIHKERIADALGTRDLLKQYAQLCGLLLLFTLPYFAQGLGQIDGHVVSDHVPVPGVRVILRHRDTAVERSTATDSRGRFHFAAVPVGTYHILVDAPGVAGESTPILRVGASQSVTISLQLSPVPRRDSVDVNAMASERFESGRGVTLNSRLLLNTPVNGRDYTRFTLQAPGAVARGSQVADLTFNGFQTIHNQFAIDGIEATRVDQPYVANGNERGARLLTGSLDSIEEVRVMTSGYEAQYGRAASAWVNIVTRSGSNQWHGGLFHFLRNESLDARNLINIDTQPKPLLRLLQTGGNVSGPVVRNRTFFFANYEASRQKLGSTVSGTVPSALLRTQALAASPALQPLFDNMPAGSAGTASPLVDTVTVSGRLRIREDTGSAKVDHQFTPRSSAFVRANVNDSEVSGPMFTTTPAAFGRSDLQYVPIRTTNVVVSQQRLVKARDVWVTTAGMQRWESYVESGLTGQPLVGVSGLTIQSGGRGGGQANNTLYQAGTVGSVTRAAHAMKFGASVWHIRLNRWSLPTSSIVFSSLPELVANRPASVSILPGDPGSSARAWQAGFFAQDSWRVSNRLSVDYGIRHDYFSPPFDPAGRWAPFDAVIGRLAAPGTRLFNPNFRNFAPRSGVAWQITDKVSFRAGYGIYFQAYSTGNATAVVSNTIPGATTVLAQEFPGLAYPPGSLEGLGRQAAPNAFGFARNKPDAYGQHWNATLVLRISAADVVETAYVGNRGVHLRRPVNINLVDPLLGRRPIAGFAGVNIETATGNSVYHALQLSWIRRFHRGVQGAVHYTFGHAIDDVPDQGLFSGIPQDRRSFGAERGNSSQDVRHMASASLLWDVPSRQTRWRFLFGGWQISSLMLLRSGIAGTVLSGVDTFGNGDVGSQRPDAIAGESAYPSERSAMTWLGRSAFRIPLRGTYGNLGRGTFHGPGLTQVDCALLRALRTGEASQIQLRVEVFNILNHPNLGQPVNVLADPAFGRIFNTVGRTIGMGTARQTQLAVRFQF